MWCANLSHIVRAIHTLSTGCDEPCALTIYIYDPDNNNNICANSDPPLLELLLSNGMDAQTRHNRIHHFWAAWHWAKEMLVLDTGVRRRPSMESNLQRAKHHEFNSLRIRRRHRRRRQLLLSVWLRESQLPFIYLFIFRLLLSPRSSFAALVSPLPLSLFRCFAAREMTWIHEYAKWSIESIGFAHRTWKYFELHFASIDVRCEQETFTNFCECRASAHTMRGKTNELNRISSHLLMRFFLNRNSFGMLFNSPSIHRLRSMCEIAGDGGGGSIRQLWQWWRRFHRLSSLFHSDFFLSFGSYFVRALCTHVSWK